LKGGKERKGKEGKGGRRDINEGEKVEKTEGRKAGRKAGRKEGRKGGRKLTNNTRPSGLPFG
jgi:hypothetical protein